MNTRLRGAVLAIAALSAYSILAVALVLLGVWTGVDDQDREALARVARLQVAFLVVAGVMSLAGLALFVSWFFSRYVLPLRRLADETRVIAQANPEHRLTVAAPTELSALTEAINTLAAEHERVRSDVTARVAAAQHQLQEERDRLAALMTELDLPVVVCNAIGQILLYNTAARDRLGDQIGLGRSVFGVVDRHLVGHALDRTHATATRSYSATATIAERLLRVRVTLVGSGPEPAGFVLTFADITSQADAILRSDQLVRALTEGTRSSLASIRAAAETLADFDEMDPTQRKRFIEVLRDEAARLTGLVESSAAESEAVLADRSLLEDVLAEDLVAALQARLWAEHGVRTRSESAESLWLSADSHGIITAVASLVASMHDVGDVRLVVRPIERHAALDVRWSGAPLPSAEVTAWADQPDVRNLLARHGAEAWSGSEHGEPYFRLLLPRAEPPVRSVPTAPTATSEAPSSRPAFYDFDLFRVSNIAAAGWDDQPLRDLSYTVVDTETTGLDPAADDVVSIGAVRIVNRRLLRLETYEQLVDPQRRIPAASYAIHGISDDMVRGQPVIAEVLPAFARFAADTVLVGHDVGFDLQFFHRAADASGVRLRQPVLDTLLLSAVVHSEHDDHSLEGIAGLLGVSVVGRHTALGDALVTGEVFIRLIGLLEERGLRTLGEVRTAAAKTAQARRNPNNPAAP